MKKKKIAILIDWYLPGTKAGGPVRSIFSLLELLKGDFDFYLITSNHDLGSDTTYPGIKANTWISNNGINLYYFSNEQLNKPNLLKVIKETECDLIYLNSFWSFWYSIFIIRSYHSGSLNCPVLLAPRGMLGKGALSLKPLKKRIYLALAKYKKWYKPICFQATNEQEYKDIKKQFSDCKIFTAENINICKPLFFKKTKEINSLKLFYLSRIAKVKNLHFALDVLKEIPEQYKIEYSIFGNIEDDVYWKQCQQIINQLPKNIKVIYKNELQFNEIQDTIKDYHFLFLPTLNENYGHSIVESLMSGCPAIISDQTPWKDLEEHNSGYSIDLNNREKFVNSIVSSAKLNQEEYQIASQNAIKYISSKIDLEKIRNKYIALFNNAK